MYLRKLTILVLVCFLVSGVNLSAQKKGKKKKKKGESEQKDDSKKDEKDLLKKTVKMEGLFVVHQDTTDGTTYLGITEEQLDKEFIYFSYTENGPIWAGHIKGLFRGNKVFKIRKHYERLEFVTQNNNFYFDESTAISKAKDANISEAIMVSSKIEKTDKDSKTYYINAKDLFLSESVQRIAPTPRDGPSASKAFKLGKLNADKSKYRSIKNYPENTNFLIDYVYDNSTPKNYGGPDVTDARYNTITYQHTIIQMPENDYKVRYDDPRVGYFTQRKTDLGSTSATPYKDLVRRWHLVKKDPDAALSEPVEPITWWIENTTPVAFRPIIKHGVLEWNKAFEKAGFKNAVVVEIQPDDAEWDAGDIRYNVLRWTASPFPPWGGYGPSFTNPKTGQILGADVMLELSFVKNDLFETKLYDAGAASLESIGTGGELFQEIEEDAALNVNGCNHHNCAASQLMQLNNMMGAAYLKAGADEGYSEDKISDLIRESLHYLVLHEVGHTLGLNHNMKGTNLHSPEDAHNKELTEKIGLYNSVMDYPAINLNNDREKQGNYFTTVPGPYDHWAIEFGYSTALDDEVKEQERLEKILARSTEPELMFGNDADDMRSPGKAIDPRVMIFDMTNDPIKFGEERAELVKEILIGLKEKYSQDGESYHELTTAYNVVTGQMYGLFAAASRFVGGVYVDRAFEGQEGATKPFTPVPLETQKRAMKFIADYLLSPDAFDEPKELYSYLQRQRRGFDFFRNSEDPKLNRRFSIFYKGVFDHLLHQNVLSRMSDSELYGNEYSVFEMTGDLTKAVFDADKIGSVNTYRQNMQIDYTKKLISALNSKSYDDVAKSSILYNLKEIEKIAKFGGTGATKAHRMHLEYLIEQSLESK